MKTSRYRRGAMVVLGLLVGLQLAGCSRSGDRHDLNRLIQPPGPEPAPGFAPNSPANALRMLEWCYNNTSLPHYRELFADDYQFHCAATDTAGASWRGTPWTREDELISATYLFVGGSATEAPASLIRLALDLNFLVYPDPRSAAWDPLGRWHKNIRTAAMLSVVTVDGTNIDVSGHATFYLVRGDSALIPIELRLRGFGPDSSRWYVQRWDDETAQETAPVRLQPGAGASRANQPPILEPQPSQTMSWCGLKVRYR